MNKQQIKDAHIKRGPSFFSHPLFWVVVVLALFSLPLINSLRSPKLVLPPVLGQMKNFELTNQAGRTVTQNDFLGSVLVVNFIFTECPDVCPLLSKQMSKIQSRLKGTAKAVQLLSISVDPENDTPKVLQNYSKQYTDNNRLWTFVTGDLDTIVKLTVDDFKLALDGQHLDNLEDRMDGMMEITHSEKFVLVDQSGQIRAFMDASSPADINEIMKKVAILANTRPSDVPGSVPPQTR